MIDVLGGMVGGLGIFFVGMWLLTENLKALATRRLRSIAHRWTGNRLAGFAWGTAAATITQSMSALTFIVVSVLRAELISTKGAFAIILGGNVGVTLLVLVVTFDIELVSLYVLGVASAVLISERASRYRPVAASFFGGAMIVLGLVLLKDSAAPLADQPWFGEMVEGTGGSLLLAFLVAALLTAIVQSSSAVCVIGISMATLGVISVDQAIMVVYGSCLGSGLIQYLLSASLTARSRQVAMFQVSYNLLFCIVLVPLLYVEVYFDIPLVKALILSLDLGLGQQLAFAFILPSLFLALIMLTGLGPSTWLFERLWPDTAEEELSRTKFIHDHASADVETSLSLVDLEQRRVLETLSRYFDTVRNGSALEPFRDATGRLLAEIEHFLTDLGERHPMHGVEGRTSMSTRQKLLSWLEEQVATLCEALRELPDLPARGGTLRVGICEGLDAVLLAVLDAIETGGEDRWMYMKELTGDRRELMRRIRNEYSQTEPPLGAAQLSQVITITNSVEQVLFLLSKLVQELESSSAFSTRDLEREHVN